ncbi:M60 family metallopeptidase [Candidatus Palauibacter sp.]|uniref:M60 family metallopeptidase n=1 Tax=Candidatus Palauibacter sp. TaxID=3101350 RepID=UPI003B5AFE67
MKTGQLQIYHHPDVPNSVDHAALANLRWPTAVPFERLSIYRQLIFEFGWDAMRAVFRSYYDPDYPRATYGGELDGFAIRFSAIIQRDLVGFFRHWDYPLSDSAAATIRSFELDEWLPPGW